MRSITIFTVATVVAFGLMLAANILVLPVAFDTQAVGWSAAPFRSLLVAVGNLLQMPLVLTYGVVGNKSDFDIVSIAVLSAVYGAAVAGTWALRRWHRKARI